MKHEIIKTENYLLIVDDSEIKESDYSFYWDDVLKVQIGVNYSNPKAHKKIIAHLPLNNSPILEGVDLLPPIEDDIERIAMDQLKSKWQHLYTFGYPKRPYPTNYENDLNMVMVGLYKAKEKYKYTEDDVIKIVEKSRETGLTVEYIMLSLQQPKLPVGFECDTQNFLDKEKGIYVEKHLLQTTTNSQGQTVWVGKYV